MISKAIGWVVGRTVGLFVLFVWRLLVKHWTHPLHAAAVWSAFILFLAATGSASWWFAGALLLLTAAGFYFFWNRWKGWNFRRTARRSVLSVMASTLWSAEDIAPARFLSMEFVSAGVARVHLSTPLGFDDEAVIKTLPKFRAALNLKDTIVMPDDNAGDGSIVVLFCWVNPLETVLAPEDSHVLNLTEAERLDPWTWLTVGVDSSGAPFSLPLFLAESGSVRQMTAGASGSGKSSIVRQQLLQAVLCPSIDVVVLDGKGSEFGAYAPFVQKFGTAEKDFWDQLRHLEQECVRRSEALQVNKLDGSERRSDAWNHFDDGAYLLWVWDELGAIMGRFDTGKRMEAMSRLYGVLSIARSLGIGVILSSQTFKADILSTQIRDNCFDLSIGFKMNSTQEAAYIGFESSDAIRPDLIRGRLERSGRSSSVGTFAAMGLGKPSYGKSFYLPTGAIRAALTSIPTTEALEAAAEADRLFTKENSL